MKEILIFSAGPAGRETFQLINEINKKRKQWKVVGYVDDEIEKLDNTSVTCYWCKQSFLKKNVFSLNSDLFNNSEYIVS